MPPNPNSRGSERPANSTLTSYKLTSEKSTAGTNEDSWSAEDDIRLIRLKERDGLNWIQIEEFFPTRTSLGCKRRYLNYLAPTEGNPLVSWILDTNLPPQQKIFALFRESSWRDLTEERKAHFEERAQNLTRVYEHNVGISRLSGLTPWSLIKAKSSNTDFTDSKNKGVLRLQNWLRECKERRIEDRVVIILNQVDGFTTNVPSWKRVLNAGENHKLDLWLFFVHDKDRQSLLKVNTLQQIITQVETGSSPQEVVRSWPEAHEYVLTLLFMAGVSVNKKNISANAAANKQLKIGMRNNFDLGLAPNEMTETFNTVVMHAGHFYSQPLHRLDPQQDGNIDEFLDTLSLPNPNVIEMCVLCDHQVYQRKDHYRLHFDPSLKCDDCNISFQTLYEYAAHATQQHMLHQCDLCEANFDDPSELLTHFVGHFGIKVLCRFCAKPVDDLPEGFDGHSMGMKNHIQICHLAPRPYVCTQVGCSYSFASAKTLLVHCKVSHTQADQIDKFAIILGLRQGNPVTPEEISALMRLPRIIQDTDKDAIATEQQDDLRLSSPLWCLRPSKDFILAYPISDVSNSADGEEFSLDDDIRIIRLREINKLSWPNMKKFFPNRDTRNLSARYRRCLLNAADEDSNDDENENLPNDHEHVDALTVEDYPPSMLLKGIQFSNIEIEKLKHLKDVQKLGWDEIVSKFEGTRTKKQLQAKYHGMMSNETRLKGSEALSLSEESESIPSRNKRTRHTQRYNFTASTFTKEINPLENLGNHSLSASAPKKRKSSDSSILSHGALHEFSIDATPPPGLTFDELIEWGNKSLMAWHKYRDFERSVDLSQQGKN